MPTNLSVRFLWLPAIALVSLLTSGAVPCAAADDCVIIVNKANPLDSMSEADVRKLFLGEKAAWPDGTKAIPITPTSDKPEYGPAIKKTTGMSGADLKRYFIQLSFLGKAVSPPKTLDSSASIAKFVSASRGAISCVPAADAGPTVKILKN